MSLSPSSRIGFYQILAPIGSGGMGEVYRAKDTRLGREVALKILTLGKADNQERKQRFLQEAQSASSLHHPNIITIFDVGSEGGVDYIAMELVKGKPLEDLIPPTGFRLNEVLKYAIQISDALAAAHDAGIVHRDLKPANIMVTDDGQTKLLDFGLAKLTENGILGDVDPTADTVSARLTVEGTILGTVSYMSPEQAEGKRVDGRSDIFSFGSILYEMLTGKKAFNGGTMVSTLSSILRDEPAPVGEVANDKRGELERIISRCLRKDPERRWNNMSDLRSALQDLREESLSGSGVAARIAPKRVPPQSPKTSWVLAAGIVVVAVAAGWFTMHEKGNYPLVPPTPPMGPNETAAVKSSAFPDDPAGPLTNDQIIKMVKSSVKKSTILSQIRNSKTKFSFTTEELIRMSKEGVPDDVIEVMRNPGPAASAAGDPAATAPVDPPQIVHGTLKAGDPVILLTSSDLLFSAQDGSKLEFEVAADVMAGGHLVIAKGAPAVGTLMDAEKRKLFGRGGKITIRLESVKAVDGQSLKFRTIPVTAPASKLKSKDIALEKDSPVTGLIGQDYAVNVGVVQK